MPENPKDKEPASLETWMAQRSGTRPNTGILGSCIGCDDDRQIEDGPHGSAKAPGRKS